jgi:diadenosine tetraphosphate (Ap4A) HIT family hydrolase
MLPEPFNDTEEYRDAFTQGLVELLRHDQLGTYILVLANATYDTKIHRKLKQQLELRFEELASLLTRYLKDGRTLDHTSDDLLVFLKLMAVGFSQLQMSKFRQAGPWQIQYNLLRSFRPARMSNETVTELLKPFNQQDFHFNKHFLEKEIMWRGSLHGRECSLLYNKFPFAPLHGLLAVEPKQNQPQFLDQNTHNYLWQLAEQMGNKMPGVGFGYNSRGAFASVNHQHFHMYVQDKGMYPIEQSLWAHNGGTRDYPLPCQSLRSMSQAWKSLRELHGSNLAYNLLYRPGVLYLIPRSRQGTYEHMDWTDGFAWAEIAGSTTTFREGDFMQLDELQITNELKKLAVCPEKN